MKPRATFISICLASTAAAVGLTVSPVAYAAGAAAPPAAKSAPAERGRYLVNAAGCHDCHTPLKMGANGPEPDMSRMLSGHPERLVMPPAPRLPDGPWLVTSAATNTAWAGPWGVSYSANLTPDGETGLGRWTERQFVDTIRSGRHLGVGRAILPPMPIAAYRQFSDADLRAIYAHLRTLPAVSNRVPGPSAPVVAATSK